MSAGTVVSSSAVVRVNGRWAAHCEVDGYDDAPTLFACLRADLVAAIRCAAALDPDARNATRSWRLHADPDGPALTIWVLKPAKCLANLNESMAGIERLLARMVAGHLNNVRIAGEAVENRARGPALGRAGGGT